MGIVVVPNEKLTFKALFATAYRAPNSFDLFTETPIRIANPDLNPETSNNYEFSVGYQVSDNTHLESILFYNHLEEMIVSNVTLGDIDNDGTIETQNQNVGTANIYGIELRSRHDLAKRLKAFFNFSYQRSELIQVVSTLQPGQVNGEDIPNTAKIKANFGFSWQSSDSSSAYLAGRFVGKRSTAHTNPRESIPSFFVTDLVVSCDLSFLENMSVSLRINNLWDRDYADPGIRSANGLNFSTQHDYPGRQAWLKLNASF